MPDPMAPLVTVRPYQPSDFSAVADIFADGMLGLWPEIFKTAMASPASTCVATAAASAAVAITRMVTQGKSAPWLAAVAGLCGAAVLPFTIGVKAYTAMRSYVVKSLSEDLKDIPQFYCAPSGFWVAEAPGKGVVGMVALERHSESEAQLRRLSVRRDMRGAGVASKLCQELIRHAKAAGFKSVYLLTSSVQQPALRVYWRLGWQTTEVIRREGGSKLFGDLHFYKLTLQL